MTSDIAKIDIEIGDKTISVEVDKADYPLYFNETYGPNEEYRMSMLRRAIISKLLFS